MVFIRIYAVTRSEFAVSSRSSEIFGVAGGDINKAGGFSSFWISG